MISALSIFFSIAHRAIATAVFLLATILTVVAAPPRLVIVMLDTSGSTSKNSTALRDAAGRVIWGVPENAIIGAISFDIEARKSAVVDAARRGEIVTTIERNAAGGAWTDPARAVDAAMSLAQQAGSSDPMLIIFTDGKASLPPTFRDRAGFGEVLARELEVPGRERVRCILVIVGTAKLKGLERLGDRIITLRVASTHDLGQQVHTVVLPTLSTALTTLAVQPSNEVPAEVISVSPSPVLGYLPALAGLALLVALAGLMIFKVRRQKRDTLTSEVEGVVGDQAKEITGTAAGESANVDPASLPDPLVAILRAAGQDRPTAKSAPTRIILRAGERAIIGRSAFASISLDGLAQSETLEVKFDGGEINAVRIRKNDQEKTDRVEIGDREAPIKFTWPIGAELRVGGYVMHASVVSQRQAASLMHTPARSAGHLERHTAPGAPPVATPHFDL